MRRILSLLIFLVVVGGIAGFLWVWRYQPLEAGPVFGTIGTEFSHERGHGPAGGGAYGRLVPYSQGGEVAYYFTLRNAGPLAVSVAEVDVPDRRGFILRPVEVRMGEEGGVVAPGETVPFEPFSLGRGEERLILVRWRFGDCRPELAGLESRFSGVEWIGFRFLGLGHRARVVVPGVLLVEAPADCPAGG